MRKLRAAICISLLFAPLAACGREDGITADRVVSSPTVTVKPKPKATKPAASPTTTPVLPTDTPRKYTTAPTPRRTVIHADLSRARIKLTKVVSIADPVAMAIRSGDTALYVVSKDEGTVRPVRGGKVGAAVLNISSEISTGGEQGLLGLAFSKDGKKLYVYFTSKTGSGAAGDDVVREYAFSGTHATSPRDVLRVADPEANHNGGNILFGPDGYLYIGIGDGGGAGDMHGTTGGNGQDTGVLLGKMLRINPKKPPGSAAYSVPASNPFIGKAGRDEIWAYGLRNPWRFSFDRSTKDLWIADVGQDTWEEIDYAKGGSDGGDNYGWRRMEGTHSYNGGTAPPGHHAPIYEYSHSSGGCSVTGGYVYRGSKIQNLKGAYVFADYCAGALRAFKNVNGRASGHRFLGPQSSNISSFGQDAAGELYVLSLDGALYRIDPA